jgi:TusA-related sulfurtransferase
MRKLDIRGLIRPFTFLVISNAFKELRVGETVEILWDDPDSLTDLFKILPAASYEKVLMEAIEGKDSGIRIRLKKTTQPQGGMGYALPRT